MARSTDKRWKGIIIDWAEISDMDSEDYELKPLNQQQVAILLALLEYQKWPTRWDNLDLSRDELETYIADIEQRLMRNEGGMATQEDIAKGMYQAFNWLALQVATGQYANIALETDEDGVVSLPSGEVKEEPVEDDPATPINETDASLYGAMISIGTKLEEVIDKLDSLYGASNGAPTTTEALAFSTMKLMYPFDENALSTAVSAYYAYRATNAVVAFNSGDDFFRHMFCNGYDIQTLNRFLINIRLFAAVKTGVISDLWASLLDRFWSQNYEIGAKAPSTKYLDAACVKTASQEHLIVPLNVNRQFFGLKANHNVLLTFKGYVTDSDGDLQDAFWYRTAAGVLTRSNPTFGYGAGVAQPSDNEVPYNTSHVYQFTMQLPNASTTMTINIGENAGIGTPIYQADQFTIQFQDMGLPYGS